MKFAWNFLVSVESAQWYWCFDFCINKNKDRCLLVDWLFIEDDFFLPKIVIVIGYVHKRSIFVILAAKSNDNNLFCFELFDWYSWELFCLLYNKFAKPNLFCDFCLDIFTKHFKIHFVYMHEFVCSFDILVSLESNLFDNFF